MDKILKTLIPLVVAGLIAWAGWLTTGVFSGEKDQAVSNQKVNSLECSINEIKTDIKDMKRDIKDGLKEADEKREQSKREIMEILKDIRREVKK